MIKDIFMKKITIKQYAEALYQTTKSGSAKALKEVLQNFVKLLVKNKNLKLADKIITKFNQIYNQHEKIEEVEIITHQKLSGQTYQAISKWLEGILKKKIYLTKIINQKLMGGFIIKYQDVVLDSSMLRQLNNLHNFLLK